jgi:hypothetical protein
VSEATGRASMFFASVSGGLVALSLMATAAKIGTAFYVLALTVLPTLSFVGLATFDRVLQNRLEDLIDANRIAWLRGFLIVHGRSRRKSCWSFESRDRGSACIARGGVGAVSSRMDRRGRRIAAPFLGCESESDADSAPRRSSIRSSRSRAD